MAELLSPAPDNRPGTITASQARAIATLLFDVFGGVITPQHTGTISVRDKMGRTLLMSQFSERQAGDVLELLEARRRYTRPAPGDLLRAAVERMNWGGAPRKEQP